MKETLKHDPILTPAFKAYMLRDRYEMFTRSINDWCNLLIADRIIEKYNPHLQDFTRKDRERLNAWLYDYAAFCGGEM